MMNAIINDTFVEEFLKDVRKLTKKYHHLETDLKLVKQVLAVEPNFRNAIRISDLGKDVKIPVFKLRKIRSQDFKGLGSRSGFRLIYAYDEIENTVFLIEIYHKNKQSNHDKIRIHKYFKEKDEKLKKDYFQAT